MPLIPYPDVPYGAGGVPQVPIAPAGYEYPIPPANTSELESQQNAPVVATSNFSNNWQIVDQYGNQVLIPDSVISFEYRNDRNIPNYPVEQGGFASYNKVALPYNIRTILSCGGSGAMTRAQFLVAVETLLDSTDLYSIITPDLIYENANLIHVNFRREARSGATLLKVEMFFEEVRTTAISKSIPREPSGNSSVKNGQVSPVPPTAAQTASIFSTPIQK